MTDDMPERVRRGFDGQGFMATLGAEMVYVAPGECHIRLPYREALSQQHGFFHGGVTASVADNAAGFAAYTVMSEDEQPLTVEFKISLLEAATGEFMEARSRVIRAGRRLKHAQSDVYTISGDTETLVATALVTVATSRSVTERPLDPGAGA